MPTLAIPERWKRCSSNGWAAEKGSASWPRSAHSSGASSPTSCWRRSAAKNRSEFDDELEQLTRTELVFRRGTPPEATYAFKHALVQDAAYNSMPTSKRSRLHAGIADVLEKEFPQLAANEPELLAHHRTEAGDLMAAIPLWRSAGESALARVALQEAVPISKRACPSSIDLRRPPSATTSSSRSGSRCTRHACGGAAGRRRRSARTRRPSCRLAQRQRQPQSLLIGLWGMWVNTITQGRVVETPAWARRLLVEGTQSGDIDLQIFGHRALPLLAFLSRGAAGGAGAARPDPGALRPRHARRWMELTGNDTRRRSASSRPSRSGCSATRTRRRSSATRRTPILASWGSRSTSAGP